MAKDEGKTMQSVACAEQDVTLALDELDVPGEEKQELQQDLEELNTATTEKQKEKPRTKIKNWFKKHWAKVVGVVGAVIPVAAAIALVVFGVKKYNEHQKMKRFEFDFDEKKEEIKEQEMITIDDEDMIMDN